MLQSFACKETERVFAGRFSKNLPPDIQSRALAKLIQLNQALELDELRVPPSNRLEALKGSREGQHSMRINGQWRICFVWKGQNAHQVEIVDYH